ncbi:glycoside hydrolase [Staphylococcus auricularis]|uniref:Glycosyltransferase family 4 protein n=1 Tax=Staphylococcus auricularis TaxID=29379 RepID=A0AAP8TTF9_9STAP|nr:glycosyltransferase family 4 protein [Staphylococcus auricularis]PNZ68084.1 glycosyltransferase family 4 protein [Staphylococcus auricularis]QPT06526.1 glycosyltransferase family 4 protein [Staphylococcus auricularis]BCU53052.1 glycoside hydrolase [Staphylococcus auricularis]SQJ15496.1 glycosyltransferase [Staphylococcus auricularis]
MKSITFLMHNIYAMGGTVKSVTQLANTLAEKGHAVTIISVFRGSKQPYFELDPRIQIRNLTDYRPDPRNFKDIFINRLHKYTGFSKTKWLSSHEPGLSQFNHHVEKKIIKAIRSTNTDVLVGTRASYNILISKHGAVNIEKVGMEHMNLGAYPVEYRKEIVNAYQDLDRITTLTSSDQKRYQRYVKTPVYIVPNILDEPTLNLAKAQRIVAAGRLEYEKGFDLLIESIRVIQQSMRQLNYTLSIYGEGTEREHLQQLIDQYELNDCITLHPHTRQLAEKLAQSEMTIVPSRNEGFGMVILEAMNQGSIVISFDQNTGPESIIDNNINGYLVEHGNSEALGYKIRRLMNQELKNNPIIDEARKTVDLYKPEQVYQAFRTAINDKS